MEGQHRPKDILVTGSQVVGSTPTVSAIYGDKTNNGLVVRAPGPRLKDLGVRFPLSPRTRGTNMLSAQEAKLLSVQAAKIPLEDIERKIQTRAIEGYQSVNYPLSAIPYQSRTMVVDTVIQALRAAGYKAVRYSGSDQRDNSDWDYIEISWL